VASIGPAISFRSFDVSHKEEMGRVYHYFNTQFLLNFSVLCLSAESDILYFSGHVSMFQCGQYCLEISLRTFDVSHRRR